MSGFNRYILILTVLMSFIPDIHADRRRKDYEPVDSSAVSFRGIREHIPSAAVLDLESSCQRLDFYAANNFNTYIYAPSEDRYSVGKGWRYLYPDKERLLLRSLAQECSARGLEFVWTVSPDASFRWDDSGYDNLLNKIVMIYYNGIRSFALDLSSSSVSDPQALADSLSGAIVRKHPDPVRIIVLDSIAALDYPAHEDAAHTLMRGFSFDEEFVSKVKRDSSVVCSLHDTDELSRLAVISVSDLAADPDSYDPAESLEKGISTLAPEVRQPFRFFLSHTCGSAEVETFGLDGYTTDKAARLMQEFVRMEEIPSAMEKCTNETVLGSLRPWLEEFGRLGGRGRRLLESVELYEKGDIGGFWMSYITNLMTPEDTERYRAHPVSQDRMQLFYEDMTRQLEEDFTLRMTGGRKLKNLASTLYGKDSDALDSDITTSCLSGGYMAFPIPAEANTCVLLTGDLPDGERLLFRQVATDGSLVAEFVVKSPYTVFDIKDGAVKVDVVGNVEIFETIFVYL